MRVVVLVLIGVLLPTLSVAQSEQALREFFEGTTVVARLDMPATSAGVDVYPAEKADVDWDRQSARLKSHGAAICRGEQVTITRLKVKKRHIEFQLAGGGHNAFRRSLNHRGSYLPNLTGSWPKSRALYITGLLESGQLEWDEYSQLAGERESLLVESGARHDWRKLRGMPVEGVQGARVDQSPTRDGGGSRFNIRYPENLPEEALMPESVMSALNRYLEF